MSDEYPDDWPCEAIRQIEGLKWSLKKIANWRKDAHEHDEDMGHDLREFGEEDWNHVEAYAKAAMEITVTEDDLQ